MGWGDRWCATTVVPGLCVRLLRTKEGRVGRGVTYLLPASFCFIYKEAKVGWREAGAASRTDVISEVY